MKNELPYELRNDLVGGVHSEEEGGESVRAGLVRVENLKPLGLESQPPPLVG
jgi:hypothetical protein